VAPVFIDLPELALPKVDKNRPDFELSDIQMSMFNHPHKEWDISAKTASIYTKDHQTQINDISGVIYQKGTKPAIRFSSPKAFLNDEHTHFEFEDSTWQHIKTEPVLRFFAPQLLWNTETSLISGSQTIKLDSPLYRMSAQTFKTSLNEDTLYLSGRVTIRISLEP